MGILILLRFINNTTSI